MDVTLLDQVFLRPMRFLVPLLLLTLLPLIRSLVPARTADFLRPCLTDSSPSPVPQKGQLCFWLGLLLSTAILFFLERQRQGAFFLDDDNLTQFLPVILRGCEHFFATGHLPTWNPYQLMGAPTLSIGTYALAYPFTYLSYALARFCLHDPAQTLEFFCGGHLLGGYIAAFSLSRTLGLRPSLALCVGLCWAWCGYTLLCAWYYMAPLLTYAPLLFREVYLLEKQPPSWLWYARLGAILGLFAMSGNIQMWVYALLILLAQLFLRVHAKTLSPRRALSLVPALLLGIAVAAPALVPSFQALGSLQRPGMVGYHLPTEGLLSLLVPYPVQDHPKLLYFPDSQNPAQHLETTWFYAGTPLVAVALWTGLFLLAHRSRLPHPLILGLLALVLGMGDEGILWNLLVVLPKFNQFQHAGKFLFFALLFLSLAGAQTVERLLTCPRVSRHTEWVLVGLSLIGLLLHLTHLPERLFVERGYPALLPELAQALADKPQGRLLSIAPCQNELQDYGMLQSQGFSTAYRVLNVGGYDPLVSQQAPSRRLLEHFQTCLQTDPDAVLRATGVRWILVSQAALQQAQKIQSDITYPLARFAPAVLRWLPSQTTLRLRTQEFFLYELPQAAPLAFCSRAPQESLPISFDEEGVTVALEPMPFATEVTINVLERPGFVVRGEGGLVQLARDAWGRVVVTVPPNTRQLRLELALPWRAILGFGGALVLLSALGMASLRHWEGKSRAGTIPPNG